jgi:hypothetical protein
VEISTSRLAKGDEDLHLEVSLPYAENHTLVFNTSIQPDAFGMDYSVNLQREHDFPIMDLHKMDLKERLAYFVDELERNTEINEEIQGKIDLIHSMIDGPNNLTRFLETPVSYGSNIRGELIFHDERFYLVTFKQSNTNPTFFEIQQPLHKIDLISNTITATITDSDSRAQVNLTFKDNESLSFMIGNDQYISQVYIHYRVQGDENTHELTSEWPKDQYLRVLDCDCDNGMCNIRRKDHGDIITVRVGTTFNFPHHETSQSEIVTTGGECGCEEIIHRTVFPEIRGKLYGPGQFIPPIPPINFTG